MRIALVDDDAEFAASLHKSLADAGHKVVASRNGTTFLRLAKAETFDLVLLDWGLPDREGSEVIGGLRRDLYSDVPIILLMRSDDIDEIIAGLERGADEYFAKSTDHRLLLARVAAITRRRDSTRGGEPLQSFGNFVFDSSQEVVRSGDQEMQLTSKEFQLALVLFGNQSRPLSRAYLLETIWNPHPDVQTRTLDSHVARLRAKLDLRPHNGWKLAPIYNYGYRLEPVDSGAHAGAAARRLCAVG